MSNNWVDLDNSSLFMTIGSNFVSNHPASAAHVNAARYDTHGRGRNAGLIVVDPVQTRTARQINPGSAVPTNPNDQRKWDRYIRIRPGTNIAFVNGILNGIFDRMYAARAAGATDPDYTVATNFFAWHNSTSANHRTGRAFIADDGTSTTVANWPKYCDSRLKVNNDAFGDYQRATFTNTDSKTITNFPVLAASVEDPDCVFQKMRAHYASYDAATVADICGCTEDDITHTIAAWIANSRMASSDFDSATATPTAAGYRAACVMYALGATMHTSGSAQTRVFSVIELLLGNMGRAGGGINALRGIHNVQGSTDMGMLYDSIPGYSANPGVSQTYTDYSNKLFGNRVLGTGAIDPWATEGNALGLQQKGFYNMTREWFGSKNVTTQADFEKLYDLWPKGNGYMHVEAFRRMALDPADAAHNPGDANRIKGFVCWGSNPALAESNQNVIRTALERLDVLIMTELFATETVQCSRKSDGWTYLFPTCAHPEEAGCVSGSGRWVQWRDRCTAPKGNSKSDIELLLRFAKALNDKGGFNHIKTQWSTISSLTGLDPYTVLYGKYGYDGVSNMEALTGNDADGNAIFGNEVVVEEIFKEMASPLNANLGTKDAVTGVGTQLVDPVFANATYKYRGTVWIFSGAADASGYNYNKGNVQPVLTPAIGWASSNRSKSRVGMLTPGAESASLQYPRFSWAWLLNRRIWYNNSELSQDVADVFVAPGYLGRLWNIGSANTLADYSTLYRTYNQMKDVPSVGASTAPHVHAGRLPAHTEPVESPRADLVARWGQNRGRNVSTNALSSESDNGTLIYAAGNAKGYMATPVGAFADFPLVLTQGRAVEHFQGGANTRNNAWNHEMEPEPWIDINSVDALKYGIKDGDYVNLITARGGTKVDEAARTNTVGAFAEGGAVATALNRGWKARVGVGSVSNQAVAPGVVHVPWHWGERGLSKGARINDLSIDAWDANGTNIEWKACLCRIEKA
jgi:formate dehydrogenase major subunit